MRRAILLLLACAACAPRTTTTTLSSSVTTVQVASASPGGLAAFVAAVPAFAEGGECRTVDEGRRMVTLRFAGPGETARTLALTVDAQGEVVNYSDIRGDLQLHGTGPRTVVSVNFENGAALAINERGDAPGVVMGTAAEAMELENLGNPRRTIELVKRRCMGARS